MLTSFPMTDSNNFFGTAEAAFVSWAMLSSFNFSFNWSDFIFGKKMRRALVLIIQLRTVIVSSYHPSAISLVCCRMLDLFRLSSGDE